VIAIDLGGAAVDGLRDAVGITACWYALASIGLNIQFGYAGLMNFGHVASALVGAYGTAISVDQGLPLWVGVLVGVLAGLVLGLLLGIPTLRLRADYLAIVTISVAEILRVVVNSARLDDITGGPNGINRIAEDWKAINPIPEGRYGWGSWSFNQNDLWTMILGWTLVVLGCVLVWRLARSPWGRTLKAIREDEEAARSLGKNVFAAKLQALALGSVFGALAGVILALDGGFVQPGFFLSQVTFNWYLVAILGGLGTVLGAPVGAIVYWFVISVFNSILTQAIGNDRIWFIDATDTGAIRYVIVGVAVILLLTFRPQGLLGDKKEALVRDH
jgi:neutral amino acid transport system permease protein